MLLRGACLPHSLINALEEDEVQLETPTAPARRGGTPGGWRPGAGVGVPHAAAVPSGGPGSTAAAVAGSLPGCAAASPGSAHEEAPTVSIGLRCEG